MTRQQKRRKKNPESAGELIVKKSEAKTNLVNIVNPLVYGAFNSLFHGKAPVSLYNDEYDTVTNEILTVSFLSSLCYMCFHETVRIS